MRDPSSHVVQNRINVSLRWNGASVLGLVFSGQLIIRLWDDGLVPLSSNMMFGRCQRGYRTWLWVCTYDTGCGMVSWSRVAVEELEERRERGRVIGPQQKRSIEGEFGSVRS